MAEVLDGQNPLFVALRQLCLKAGNPSNRRLAEMCGQSRSTVNYSLRGTHLPRWEVVHDMVEALGGDTAEFLVLYEQTIARGRPIPMRPRRDSPAAPSPPPGCPGCGCVIADQSVHAGACQGARRARHLQIAMAPQIAADSWLQEQRFAEFRAGYGYASGASNAIPGLSKIDPEDAYHIWWFITRGVYRHRGINWDEETPGALAPLRSCPTACEPDCQADCHELHKAAADRDHQPDDCPGSAW